ncbi:unannotated protein [freshwater metagenome]|uniref:Unannotated protein n=1 Tax=freshwater metagenome TaxID=449393 RepID=A0A6J6KN10_9ZZZZ
MPGALRGLNLASADTGDSLSMHICQGDSGVKGERRQNAGLLSGIESFDVCGRVSLGVAEPGCLCQSVLETQTLLVHLIEDVVGGAINNSHDFGDVISGQ